MNKDITSFNFICEMLEKEKIMCRNNGKYLFNPQFYHLLQTNLRKNPSNIEKGIIDTVKSYMPTSSISERILACKFVGAVIMLNDPKLEEKFLIQNDGKIKDSEDDSDEIDETIKKIKMERENK